MKCTLVGMALLLLLAAANPIDAWSLSSLFSSGSESRDEATGITNEHTATTTSATTTTAPTTTCDSSTVRISLIPGTRACGTTFQALVSTTASSTSCPISSGGLTICNATRGGCSTCTTRTTTAAGVVFTCFPLQITGLQIITATYALGPLVGAISTSSEFTCASPVPSPVAPAPTSTCSSATIVFDLLPGSRGCGSQFQALLRSTAPSAACPLSSGGLTVCAPGLPCSICNVQVSTTSGITFHCFPLAFSGVQTITVTYAFGPLVGTIATAAAFTCSTPTPLAPTPTPIPPPLHVNPPLFAPTPTPPPLHVNPPLFVPTPTPPPLHVNPPLFAPTTNCPTANVQLSIVAGTPRVCGTNFQALLSVTPSTPGCPLTSGGLTICAPGVATCSVCNNQVTTANGILFTCLPLTFNGVQSITATFALGTQISSTSTSGIFSCPTPPTVAPTPPPLFAPTPPPIAPCTTTFTVPPIVNCQAPFPAILSSNCPISQATTQICTRGNVCRPCPGPLSGTNLLFNCPGSSPGAYAVTTTFQLAGTSGGSEIRPVVVSSIGCPVTP